MDKNRKGTSVSIATIPGKQEDRWPLPCVWRYCQELLDMTEREQTWNWAKVCIVHLGHTVVWLIPIFGIVSCVPIPYD